MSEAFDMLLFFVSISKPNRQFGVSLGETQHMKELYVICFFLFLANVSNNHFCMCKPPGYVWSLTPWSLTFIQALPNQHEKWSCIGQSKSGKKKLDKTLFCLVMVLHLMNLDNRNTEVASSLLQACYLAVIKPISGCVHIACFGLVITSLLQVVNRLDAS